MLIVKKQYIWALENIAQKTIFYKTIVYKDYCKAPSAPKRDYVCGAFFCDSPHMANILSPHYDFLSHNPTNIYSFNKSKLKIKN